MQLRLKVNMSHSLVPFTLGFYVIYTSFNVNIDMFVFFTPETCLNSRHVDTSRLEKDPYVEKVENVSINIERRLLGVEP